MMAQLWKPRLNTVLVSIALWTVCIIAGWSQTVFREGGIPRMVIATTGNVGIGTTTPTITALLELTSTSAGILIPRLTQAERDAINSPALWLLIFNTTAQQFEYWNGSQWIPLISGTTLTSSSWSLTGNAGTDPATNFLGTTDNQPLVIRTNNTEVIRITTTGDVGIGTNNPVYRLHVANDGMIYAEGTFNSGDVIPSGAKTAFIWNPRKAAIRAGQVTGNQWDDANVGNYSVAFGWDNTASGDYSTVGGGLWNTASGIRSTVGGGWQNTASYASTVGGGNSNDAIGFISTIGGGLENTASSDRTTIGGGAYNTASGYSSTVGGGENNTASGIYSTVGGGQNNTASGSSSTVSGGEYNTASGIYSTVGGGQNNTASGFWSTVSGGEYNTAGGDYSWAGGRFMYLNAAADRTFVWGYATATTAITASDAFLIGPYGNSYRVGINVLNPTAALHVTAGTWAYPLRLEGLQPLNNASTVLVTDAQGIVYTTSASALAASNAWLLTGNAGTNPASNFLGTTDNQPLVIRTNNTEVMRITVNGYVGIGTDTPGEMLDIVGNSDADLDLTSFGSSISTIHMRRALGSKSSPAPVTNNNNLGGIEGLGYDGTQYVRAAGIDFQVDGPVTANVVPGRIVFRVRRQGSTSWGGEEQVFIKNDGKVGIGVAHPTHRLHVVAETGEDPLRMEGLRTTTATVDLLVATTSGSVHTSNVQSLVGTVAWLLTGNAATNPATNFLGTTDNQPLIIKTNSVERMRIAATGNVGIGTALPSVQLHVKASSNPLRLEGLQPLSNASTVLAVDGSGVVYTTSASAFIGATAWLLSGNVLSGGEFLGSVNNIPVVVRVNNQEAFRWNTNASIQRRPGGNTRGYQAVDLQGSGASASEVASGDYSVLGGGINNTASGYGAVVSGGVGNTASGSRSGVGSGENNLASGNYGTIAGGRSNQATVDYATVGGGYNNWAQGHSSLIAGGSGNRATANASFVVGGQNNQANGNYGGIIGGQFNVVSGAHGAAIIGDHHEVSGFHSVVVGGSYNRVWGSYSTILNGEQQAAGGSYGVILGGRDNAAHGDYMAVGGRSMYGTSSAHRTFVWGYATATTAITASDAFLIGPYGNSYRVGINVLNPTAALHVNAGTWSYPLRVEGLPSTSASSTVLVSDAGGIIYTTSASSLVGSNVWLLTGNAGTNPASNFLGTTDNQPLSIRSNNKEVVRISTSGVQMLHHNTTSVLSIGPNQRVKIQEYQPHSGTDIGAPVWGRGRISVGGTVITGFWPAVKFNTYWNPAVSQNVHITTGSAFVINHEQNPAANNLVIYYSPYQSAGQQFQYNVGLALTTSGNVGIGTDAPTAKLHISAASTPLRLEGLQSTSATTTLLAADGQGVVYATNASSLINNQAWSLLGNSGTDPAVNFVGTIDAQPLVFRTGNVERARITTAGHLGIGTSNPGWLLDVAGSVHFGTSGNFGTITADMQAANVYAGGLQVRKRGTTGDANAAVVDGSEIGYHDFWGWDGSNYKRLAYVLVTAHGNITPGSGGGDYAIVTRDPTTNTEETRLFIDARGYVGIGTTTPQRRLVVGNDDINGISLEEGSSPNAGYLRFGDNTGWKFHIGRSRESTSGPLNTGTAGVLVTIQDNGNVGIGTTAPARTLVIEDDAAGANLVTLQNKNNGGYTSIDFLNNGGTMIMSLGAANPGIAGPFSGDAYVHSHNGADLYFGVSSLTGDIIFSTNNYTERMRITADGNVGIGNSAPPAALTITNAMELRGSGNVSSVESDILFTYSGGIAAQNSLYFFIDADNDNDDINSPRSFRFRHNGETISSTSTEDLMVIQENGRVGIGVSNPSNILTIVQNSPTDPIADAWTTYSTPETKIVLGKLDAEALEEYLRQFKQLPVYRWQRTESEPIRVSAMAEPGTPSEIMAYDEKGEIQGIDLQGYIGFLHTVVKAQQQILEQQQATIQQLQISTQRQQTEIQQLRQQLATLQQVLEQDRKRQAEVTALRQVVLQLQQQIEQLQRQLKVTQSQQ